MSLFKLCFYVPVENAEQVKSAVFAAGAGRIGNYDCCAWQVQGEGQFRPLTGSDPHIGQRDRVEKVAEYRIEMVCQEAHLKAAIAALRQAHPYEEPAIDVWRLEMLP
ncbi:MAG: YqfO family protein [Alcanivoracaceae bacterium]|jgi:hypothetical protein|nr:YqfO family protein [Alcanivoracaceae bacterium]